MKTKPTIQPPAIPPALVLEPSERAGLVNFCIHRIPGSPLAFEPVPLAEACVRTKTFFAEVATDWDGDCGLILHEDLPDELMDLIDSLSADSGQQ